MERPDILVDPDRPDAREHDRDDLVADHHWQLGLEGGLGLAELELLRGRRQLLVPDAAKPVEVLTEPGVGQQARRKKRQKDAHESLDRYLSKGYPRRAMPKESHACTPWRA